MQEFNLDEALDTARTKVAEAAADIDMITMNIPMAGAMTAQVGHSIHEALKDAEASRRSVAKAQGDAARVAEQIANLERTGHAIGKAIQLIRDVARQTNMLALNAKIEAARAGEAGRGFSVVAEEVKTLASQVATTTQRITSLLADVVSGSEAAQQSVEALQQGMTTVDEMIGTLTTAVANQGEQAALTATHIEEAAQSAETVASELAEVDRLTTEVVIEDAENRIGFFGWIFDGKD